MLTTAAGVLLAAGAGTRFGMPKVLAAHGEWLAAGVDALLRGGCGEVVVVLGAAIVDVPAAARAVVAADWSDGLSASLRTGLSAVDADNVVVHTVDTPDVGADVVRRVLDAARSSSSGLARARYLGAPGHPVVVARRHVPELLRGLRGDEGARSFLSERDDVIAVDCADLAIGRDIDTAGGAGNPTEAGGAGNPTEAGGAGNPTEAGGAGNPTEAG
jgi:nicotine blue oxidoreductase